MIATTAKNTATTKKPGASTKPTARTGCGLWASNARPVEPKRAAPRELPRILTTSPRQTGYAISITRGVRPSVDSQTIRWWPSTRSLSKKPSEKHGRESNSTRCDPRCLRPLRISTSEDSVFSRRFAARPCANSPRAHVRSRLAGVSCQPSCLADLRQKAVGEHSRSDGDDRGGVA